MSHCTIQYFFITFVREQSKDFCDLHYSTNGLILNIDEDYTVILVWIGIKAGNGKDNLFILS